MGVKVAFQETAEEQDTAVEARALVPQAAVFERDGQAYVFVIDDGILDRRAVSTERLVGSDIEITAGVVAGETIVVSGPEGLADSDSVRTRK
jgi:hypothetical protein